MYKKSNIHRLLPLMILMVSIVALATAYMAEYIFKLEPCILCLYQRLPYAATALLAVLALCLRPGRIQTTTLIICAIIFIIGGTIAFYQVGVEQHWWKAATGCGGTLPTAITLDQMNAQLTFKQPKPCDQVDWTLFGVSMATYNVAVSLLLAVASLIMVKKLKDVI